MNDTPFRLSDELSARRTDVGTTMLYCPTDDERSGQRQPGTSFLVLTDEEIMNLVNLRFISSHFDYSVFEIMAMRDHGKDFQRIAADVAQAKEQAAAAEKAQKREAAKEKDE